MRRLLLTALLLLPSPALAGGQEGPPPAAPRTAATAPVLRLTAPVGTTVNLVTETVSRTEIERVEVQGEDAAEVEAALREGLGGAAPQQVTGRASTRVQSRGPDGSVVLVDSVIVPLPGEGDVTLRFVQTLRPDGTLADLRAESDSPALQEFLAALGTEALRQQAGSGSGQNALYGFPLVPGQSRTRTATVQTQGLLAALYGGLSALVGDEEAFTATQASPLTLRSTTTYRGLNAARQHVFETQTTFQVWSFGARVGGADDSLTFRAELLPEGTRAGGTTLLRPDGLLAGSTDTQVLRLRVTVTDNDGLEVQYVLRTTQQTTVRGR